MKYVTGIYYCTMAALIICAWVIIGIYSPFAGGLYAAEYVPTVKLATVPLAPPSDTGNLWLVNHENPLDPNFIPQNLVSHHGIRLHASAYTAYNQMLIAMKADGINNLQLASAYRPYDYQENLFTGKISNLVSQGYNAQDATKQVSKILQRPGESEHQTGLALDVTITGDLTEAFADTIAGKWLEANSHKHGFIIRYPQSKTYITQITYEPWHLRYVGLPHSIIMYENNLSLEEYAQFIKDANYLVWESQADDNRYFYLVTYNISLPDESPQGLVNISSTHPGNGAKFILTFRKAYIAY